MSLLYISYISLWIVSIFGALLFFGFAFRARIRFPVSLVKTHVVLAGISVLLFTAAVVRKSVPGGFTHPTFALLFAWTTYVVYLLTFLSGFGFFLRFDLQRRHLPLRFVVFHLFLAAASFIMMTATLALYAKPPLPASVARLANTSRASWYDLHRHAYGRQRYEHAVKAAGG